MCALLSHFIKECNEVSNASAYCREPQARAAWLIPKMADCGGDQCKSRQDWKRKQRQSVSEGIIKKVQGCRAATYQTTAKYGKPQSP